MLPTKLHMKNFFSHKDSSIDFSNFNSALLIGNTEGDYSKSNGSGKSSIFESILWCLFNKSRQSMMDDIVLWGETSCEVTLEFIHEKILYRVSRTRNRMNSTSSVGFSFQDKAGDWVDISCSTSGDTNRKIENTIKLDYKTFVNSVYFRQNDISEFAEAEASRKKEILKSIIDISRWDSYEKDAKKRAKEISDECKLLSKSVEDYDNQFEKLSDARVEIESLKKEREILGRKKSSLKEDIKDYEARYFSIKESLDTDSYDKVVSNISSLYSDKKLAEGSLENLESRLKKVTADLDLLLQKEGKINSFLSSNKFVKLKDGEQEDVRHQLAHYKAEKASCEEFLKSLEELAVEPGECYACNQSITEDLHAKLVRDIEEKKNKFKEKRLNSLNEIISLEERLNEIITVEKTNSKITTAKEKLESLSSAISVMKGTEKDLSEKREEIAIKLEHTSSSIEKNKTILDSIKNEDFQKLRKMIASTKEALSEVEVSLSDNDKSMGALMERESLLSVSVEKMLADKRVISKKMKKASVFSKMSKMFGKNGIQSILLDAIIEDLEKTSNIILSSICNEPSTIMLETQRLGSDGSSVIETLDLKVRKDGNVHNFKSLSGGEKFRISLALRIALSDISSRYGGSSLEFLLLDEVNSPLDRFGVETLFVNVIKSLEDKYKILVITHDESLKENFDNIIDSTKVNGETHIVFTRR